MASVMDEMTIVDECGLGNISHNNAPVRLAHAAFEPFQVFFPVQVRLVHRFTVEIRIDLQGTATSHLALNPANTMLPITVQASPSPSLIL